MQLWSLYRIRISRMPYGSRDEQDKDTCDELKILQKFKTFHFLRKMILKEKHERHCLTKHLDSFAVMYITQVH